MICTDGGVPHGAVAIRHLVPLVVLVPGSASADDSVALGYLASRPIAHEASGIQNAGSARWGHRMATLDDDVALELGAGAELGHYGGDEPLTRFALLGGVALAKPLGAITLRIEELAGWQIAHGKITVGGLPYGGTTTRGFHDEIALAIDGALTGSLALRARGGAMIDTIEPGTSTLVRVGPFIGVELVVGL